MFKINNFIPLVSKFVVYLQFIKHYNYLNKN